MSIRGVVTQGFIVAPREVVTLGFSSGNAPPPPVNAGVIRWSRRMGQPGTVQRGGPGLGGKIARAIASLRNLLWCGPILQGDTP